MTLFAAVFFFAGLVPGFLALLNVYHVYETRNWVATPAAIISTELQTSRGDDSDTYLAIAEYHYQFNGRQYTGHRVGFGKSSDNIGSFHQDAYRELSRYKNRHQSFTAWVNPKKPGEAVLYKKIRWLLFAFQMLFMLVFSGAGAGLYYLGKQGLKRKIKSQELEQAHPEKPWKWREEWQSNHLQSLSSSTRWLATGFAFFWNLVSAPMWFVVPREVAKGNYLALLGALFPLIGIALIVWAIRQWLQFRRFGDSELILSRLPVSLGGLLNANLQLPAQIPGSTELGVTLNCIRKTTERSGNKNRSRETILWQSDQRIMTPVISGNYTLIPIRFHIPRDQPSATVNVDDSGIIWRLLISSDIPGVDFEASFELPVFDTGLTDIQADQNQPEHISKAETGLPGEPRRSGVIIEGNRYWFPPARHKGLALSMLVFFLIFGGSGAGMIMAGHPLFGGVFAFFGLLIFWGVLALLFKRSEIRLENGSIIASNGWFRLNEKLRLPSFQVKKIWIKSNMSVGKTKYYDLYLDEYNGTRHTLATNLKSRRDTQALVSQLERGLDLVGEK